MQTQTKKLHREYCNHFRVVRKNEISNPLLHLILSSLKSNMRIINSRLKLPNNKSAEDRRYYKANKKKQISNNTYLQIKNVYKKC